MAPGFRKDFVEGIASVSRELSQLAAIGQQRICGQDARASRVCHHGQPRPFWTWLLPQYLSHVEQLGNIGNAKDPATAKCRLENLIGTSHRSCMRCRRLASRLSPARLDDNDGL